MHHDIDHVLCDSFEIFNVSQESSIDLYREGSVFRNLQIPQFKTTKVSNQQWSNGWWDCFPKKSRSKAGNSAFWGGKVWKILNPLGANIIEIGISILQSFCSRKGVDHGIFLGLVNSNWRVNLPNEKKWEVLSVELKGICSFLHLNSWKFLQHDL